MGMEMKVGCMFLLMAGIVSCMGIGSAGSPTDIGKLSPGSAASLSASIADSLHTFRFDEQTGEWWADNGEEDIGVRIVPGKGVVFTRPEGAFVMAFGGIGRDNPAGAGAIGVISAQGRIVEIDRPGSSEWYLNRDDGIEQGMTITDPPPGGGPLRIDFVISGDLRPVLDDQVLVFSGLSGPVLNCSGLSASDSTGRVVPSHMELDGSTVSWVVDDRGATYPVSIDPVFRETEILMASDKAVGDIFGYSVSVSAATAIVGAPYADAGGIDRGAAYIFYRDEGGLDNWGEVKVLTATPSPDYGEFGHSVAISGTVAVVGAPNATISTTRSGAAFIFSQDEGGTDNWGQVKIVRPSSYAIGDKVGDSVAVSGDLVIVGAPLGDTGDRGRAAIFSRDHGGADNWGQVKMLSASDGAAGDNFGWSVTTGPDYALVGAPYADSYGDSRGQVYVFYRNEGGPDNWGEFRTLIASDEENDAGFGSSVEISYDWAIVGAPGANLQRGQAYMFFEGGSGYPIWGEQAILSASDGSAGDFFGWSVGIDSYNAVVGAPDAGSGGTSRGQAYLFSRDQGGFMNWGQVKIFSASDKHDNDNFGYSVDTRLDIIIVGCPYGSPGVAFGGKAYLVREIGSLAGVYRDGTWYLDRDGDGSFGTGDVSYAFGAPGWKAVTGDWDGEGLTEIGVYRDGTWYLDRSGNGAFGGGDSMHSFGAPGWTGMVGDWDGDGATEIGVYRDGTWYLDRSGDGSFGAGDNRFSFGAAGWTGITSDWDGDGATEIGVYRDGTWYLDRSGDGSFGAGDNLYSFGAAGWTGITGDWLNDGPVEIGVYRDGTWYLDRDDDGIFDGGDSSYVFGAPGWTAVPGEWVADRPDRVAVYRDGTWYLDWSGNGAWGIADRSYSFGSAGWSPVVGTWR